MTKIKQYIKAHFRSFLYGTVLTLVLVLTALMFTSDKLNWTYGGDPSGKSGRQSELEPSLVNGVMVSKDIAKRRPVAAMIENSLDARPQAALVNADIVYEAVTEGGITRFMAVFQQDLPQKAGPIRSARSYFINWLSEYDAIYVHAGGSPKAMNAIPSWHIKDYPHNGNPTEYWREPIAGVATEHTLFANIKEIFKSATNTMSWDKESEYDSWKFKDPDESPVKGGKITINFSSSYFQVDWSHNQQTNLYYRTMAGEPHKDRVTGKRISAQTVVVIQVYHSPNAPYADSGHESEWDMTVVGSGKAWVFEDGKKINGTWEKKDHADRMQLFDTEGQEIILNRGRIWVEVIPQDGSVAVATVPKASP